MDDQAFGQNQQLQDQTNQPVFGQSVDDGSLGVAHDQPVVNDNPVASDQNISAPALEPVAPIAASPPAPTPTTSTSQDTPTGSFLDDDEDDLLNLKKEALDELNPLVEHLEQTPEEKFRTTMMMIQASDNKSLLRNAYEAAKQIRDDKVRARALLDIVNEVNYFTQRQN